MCGVGGVLRKMSGETLAGQMAKLLEAQRHRGPDADGVYLSSKGTCGLVHARLAILGLSPTGRQPMSSPDGRYWITFNGEIYNFRSLRRELEGRGCQFSTGTDTEVILRLYQLDGPKFLDRLEGMFALAIWDDQEQRAFIARDPFGIKPLYYWAGPDGTLAFASELQALLRLDQSPRDLDQEALLGYFLNGSVSEPRTLVAGIQCLPAGHSMVWEAGSFQINRYWDVEFPLQSMAWEEAVSHANAALEASVRRHFVSDVPVGVFLSGGLDSSALVALAARTGVRDLRTFCLRFDEPQFDESQVALQTARHFGYSFETWRVDSEAARPVLAEYLGAMDQPSIDGFNTFCVSRYAHHAGMKVVLSGLGGDELFGGYASFRRIPQIRRLMTGLDTVGLRSVASRWFSNQGGPRRRLGAAMKQPADWGSAYWAMRGIFTPAEGLQLARNCLPSSANLPTAVDLLNTQRIAATSPPLADADQVCKLELERYLRNQLLRDSDIFSMAWSLELRVPLVDRRLFDDVAPIPSRYRLAHGKKLLAAAVPELPPWVLNKRKQGFVIPFAKWALTEWNDQLGATESRSAVKLETWYQRWALFALDQFVKRHRLNVGA